MRLRVCLSALVAVSLLPVTMVAAEAQKFPTKPVRVIASSGAGGLSDVFMRALGEELHKKWGQPIIVENRPGGHFNIGVRACSEAEPDGYTICIMGSTALTYNPYLFRKLPFDYKTAVVPVTNLFIITQALGVNAKLGVKTFDQLVDYAKKNPGKLSYASQGIGTTGHMAGELFKQVAGIDMTHVPYRGSAPAAQDLIAGHVQLLFDALPLAIGNLKNGNIRAIAIASPERSKALPDVPTTAEAGLPSVLISAWFGLYAPAKTPDTIVNWLSEQAERTFNNPDVRKKLEGMGAMLPLTKPADFKRYMSEDVERWNKVAKAGKITIGNKPK